MATISRALAQQVRERAGHRCEYCQTSEWLSGQRHEIDHIFPRSLGGATHLDNLCLACATCNGFKSDRTHVPAPDSGEPVPLYNPRTDKWDEHFAWDAEGTRLEGLTLCGRVTVALLRMNSPLIVSARAVWVAVRRHPPK